MKSGLTTSSAAPASETLRTIQSIAPPPDSIEPAFKVRRRVELLQRHHATGYESAGRSRTRLQHSGCGSEQRDRCERGNHQTLHGNPPLTQFSYTGASARWRRGSITVQSRDAELLEAAVSLWT